MLVRGVIVCDAGRNGAVRLAIARTLRGLSRRASREGLVIPS